MSSVISLDTFHWYTTPQELRRTADKMENDWRNMSVGDEKDIVHKYGKEGKTELVILVDQECIDKYE